MWSLSHVWLFVTPWTAAHQASLSFATSQSLLIRLMSTELMMPSNSLIFCHPLLFLRSIFSIIRVFCSELTLGIRWPNCWSFSFSISPSNEYSGLISFRIDWISLQSKGLSRVFSSTTDWKHQFFNDAFLMVLLSHLNGLTLTSIHDYWKNHSFDYMLKGLASNENAGCWLRNW